MSFQHSKAKLQRSFPPYSPCPQDHVDDGRIEKFIQSARTALHYEYEHAQAVELLQKSGASLEEATNAIAAAQCLRVGDGGY